jgi:hypothetical protein
VKKAIVLLLAVLYFGITTGVMVNVHYCMGEIASVNYGHEKEHACEKCGMEQKDGCCHTEHKIIKSDDDHLAVKSATVINNLLTDVPVIYFNEIVYHYPSLSKQQSSYYSPPEDRRLNSLRLYNTVFRI